VPAYELAMPSSLDEALRLLADEPGQWRPLAGGTDVMVLFNAGRLPWRRFFSIWHLAELRGIEVGPGEVALGALTTYSELRRHPVIGAEFPNLARAAAETGAEAIQNRGTLGGNIANASPAADSPPALLAYGAEIELISVRGRRRLPYDGFHTGYKQMQMQPDEMISRIFLPRTRHERVHYYRKVGTRRAQAISKVVMAAVGRLAGGRVEEAALALGSVAPTVVRCHGTEEVLRGALLDEATRARAREALGQEIAPIDDLRSSARYRRRVSENLLEEFLRRLAGEDP
jgi:CO/xanthine dehydrogenase FAD-binding subunit